MRVAYYLHCNIGKKSGVFKKVLAQIAGWRGTGHEAKLFLLTRVEEVAEQFRAADQSTCAVLYADRSFLRSLPARLYPIKQLMSEIVRWHPDLVYTRLDMYYPKVVALARRVPMVLEINSDEVVELAMYSKVQWAYHALTRSLTFRKSSGLVFVTNELAKMEQYYKYGRPSEVISNGIDLRAFSPLPVATSTKTRLCFIGQSSCPWHGINKIALLARKCRDWHFDIIGCEQSDVRGQDLPNITYHGVLSRPEYEQVLRQCQCALGTLALHRNHMQEACPLKTREYLALGLPVIIGYTDTDFPRGADFLLDIGNSEHNVASSTAKIRSFLQQWKGRRVRPACVAHLDYSCKENQRIAFFESLLRR